jgi:hypothetical protein
MSFQSSRVINDASNPHHPKNVKRHQINTTKIVSFNTLKLSNIAPPNLFIYLTVETLRLFINTFQIKQERF